VCVYVLVNVLLTRHAGSQPLSEGESRVDCCGGDQLVVLLTLLTLARGQGSLVTAPTHHLELNKG
jgi:hypothetical protein